MDKPVCNVVSNVCEGCTDASQCASYAGTTVCDMATGVCVGCVSDADCPVDKPVCDSGGCRACSIDADCPSGACAEDGKCLDAATLVYVDAAQGSDTGMCTDTSPCKTISFSLMQTSATRSHVVLRPGTYREIVNISPSTTPSPSLIVHGGGATITAPQGNDGSGIVVGSITTTLQNLNFVSNGTAASEIQTFGAPCTIKHAKVMGGGGISIGANGILSDVEIGDASTGIYLDGTSHLSLDRVVIHGGFKALRAGSAGATIDIKNLLVFDTTGVALDLPGATGTIAFSTIADSGPNDGTSPSQVNCSAGLALQSSIVWAPQAPTVVAVGGGCTYSALIAGPHAVSGAMNVNPMFVDEVHRDYHLSTGSPARDALDSGPQTDFEGDSRPQGPRFDIGADEAK